MEELKINICDPDVPDVQRRNATRLFADEQNRLVYLEKALVAKNALVTSPRGATASESSESE